MIPFDNLDFDAVMAQSQAACAALSDNDGGLKREVLAHAGNRWSLGIVHILGVAGTLRHAELARRLDGVTQRMLTRSLRQLERDGLIIRHDYGEVPPRVDYTLTPLGKGLLVGMMPLWRWIIDNAAAFRTARDRFDSERNSTFVEPRDGLNLSGGANAPWHSAFEDSVGDCDERPLKHSC